MKKFLANLVNLEKMKPNRIKQKIMAIFSIQKEKQRQLIDSVCSGYSSFYHWNFFQSILIKPWLKDVCILGVYQARDIAYMASILKMLGRKNYTIVGVDKFEDSAGNDWPEELQGLTWQEAGFGEPPNLQKAIKNLQELGLVTNVVLHQDLAETFLQNTNQVFDFIYIDISHDYETTINTIKVAIERLKPNGILGGDDFSDQNTWGVASAVKESFSKYEVFDGYIWLAYKKHFHLNRADEAKSLI